MQKILNLIKRTIPAAWRRALRSHIILPIYLIALTGNRFFCPVCERGFRRFQAAGIIPRPNARCPGCHSLERHRALWAAFNHATRDRQLCDSGTLLHVAPESTLGGKFKSRFEYTSIDLDGSQAMHSMDITDLSFADQTFDVIICNHVLEHVPDDHKAIAELYRVLKSGGWASIQVPMKGTVTKEDLSITDPQERRRLYGQEDHVRQYGTDYSQRLTEAGFSLLPIALEKILDPEDLARFAITDEADVLLVTKTTTLG